MSESSRALRDRGHDVDLWYADYVAPAFLRRKARRLLAPWCVAVRALRRARDYDVMELHEPLAWPAVLFLRRTAVVIISHGIEVRAFRVLTKVGIERPSSLRVLWLNISTFWPQRVGYRAADIVLVLNIRDARYVTEIVPKATVHVYQNGVAGGMTARVREPRRPKILFVGNLLARKGRDLVLQAAVVLAHEGITVAGDPGPDPLLPGLRWHGGFTRDEQADLFREHDILLLPSHFEGMPLGLLEAMQAGLAIVASNIGGVADIVGERDGEPPAGLLFEPNDVDRMVEHLRSLLTDLEKLAAYQQRALARVQGYTWDAAAATLERGYERATAGRNRSPKS